MSTDASKSDVKDKKRGALLPDATSRKLQFSTRRWILAVMYGASKKSPEDARAAASDELAHSDRLNEEGNQDAEGENATIKAVSFGFSEIDKMVRRWNKCALPVGQVEKDLVDLYNDEFVVISRSLKCKLTDIGMTAGEHWARLLLRDPS